jgi:HK97 family phage major capsid protein
MAVSVAVLNDEMEQLVTERNELRAKNPGENVPADVLARLGQIGDRTGRLRVLIDQQRLRENDALMNETARYMEDPQYIIPKAVNADDEGRKTLMTAGWDIRGSMVFRKTSRGEIAYAPEAALFGPIPDDDPVAAKHFKTMRATFQPEYKAAWLKWFKNRGNMAVLTGAEQNALSEGTASEGGYTVPADFQAEVLARRAETSVMRRLCRIVPTSRDRIQFPAVVPSTASPGASVYSSAFVGGMVGERVVNSDAGPTFQQFEIGIKKFEAYTKITNDLIADSASDILGFLATDGGRNLALVEDNMFLNGAGTGLEPMGLLNLGVTTFDVEGTTSNNVSNTVSDAGSAPKIVAGAYLLPGQYADGASWLMARQTQGEIHGLVDGDGRPWWQASAQSGGAGGAPPTLVNIPVYTSSFVPVDNTNTNKVLILGDFQNYIIADRTSLTVDIDTINLKASDETQIFLRSRAGGGGWNVDAFRFGIV